MVTRLPERQGYQTRSRYQDLKSAEGDRNRVGKQGNRSSERLPGFRGDRVTKRGPVTRPSTVRSRVNRPPKMGTEGRVTRALSGYPAFGAAG